MSAPGIPPRVPGAGKVQVWWASIHVEDAVLAALRADLGDERRAKVDRFVREVDRRRGTVAHGLLRRLSGSLLGVAPSDVAFGHLCGGCGSTEHGKPHLIAPPGVPADRVPEINISHSGDLVAVALSPDPIGVDVEQVKTSQDWAQLRRSVFTGLEWETSAVAPDPLLTRYRYWVAKEAALKLIGTGLSTPMREVGMIPADGSLTSTDGGFRSVAPDGRAIHVHPVDLAEGHLAAVASFNPIAAISVLRADFSLL